MNRYLPIVPSYENGPSGNSDSVLSQCYGRFVIAIPVRRGLGAARNTYDQIALLECVGAWNCVANIICRHCDCPGERPARRIEDFRRRNPHFRFRSGIRDFVPCILSFCRCVVVEMRSLRDKVAGTDNEGKSLCIMWTCFGLASQRLISRVIGHCPGQI